MPYEGLLHPTTHAWNGVVRLADADVMLQPLHWSKPRRIFVGSMSDLFHESVPDAWIDQVFAVMALSTQHTYQILTKRPRRMRDYLLQRTREIEQNLFESSMAKAVREMSKRAGHALPGNAVLEFLDNEDSWRANPKSIRRTAGWPMHHVWLGTSVENQDTADERIPLLSECPAAVRWLSCEPLLEFINFRPKAADTGDMIRMTLNGDAVRPAMLDRIDWVVVGGESGPGARPMHPQWARHIRDQCKEAGFVAFYFKQHGEWSPTSVIPGGDLGGDMRRGKVRIVKPAGESDGHFREGDQLMERVGKKKAGRLLDGVLHDAYPAAVSAEGIAAAELSA